MKSRHDDASGVKKVRVLVVGQTPPPFGGQAVMIQQMLEGRYANAELHHVRMAFSSEMDEIGRIRVKKVFHLLHLVLRIVWARLRLGTKVLYYPPAGPDLVPVVKDVFVLGLTRWMFSQTMFHFHAGGLSELLLRLPAVPRAFCRWTYSKPDLCIRLSEIAPPDCYVLKARRSSVVPYGIEDLGNPESGTVKKTGAGPPRLLFVGVVRESKGVLTLLSSCRILNERNHDFELSIVGRFHNKAFERHVRTLVSEYDLSSKVDFTGVLTGRAKVEAFRRSDIFCFPTHFESETLPVVLIEAMMFGLPIVSTEWRAIPSLVTDGENGYLVPPKDPGSVTIALERLINDDDLRQKLGQAGRTRYETTHTLRGFYQGLDRAFGILSAVD